MNKTELIIVDSNKPINELRDDIINNLKLLIKVKYLSMKKQELIHGQLMLTILYMLILEVIKIFLVRP